MLGKLLSLLIHAKSGAISGVFLLGATGALVSVSTTTNNGVTTITLTEASASPSASASHSASPTPSASPTATPTHTATPTPTASPSANTPTLSSPSSSSACTDEAKALAFQVERVDSAYTGFHTDLVKLRGERDRATVKKADAMLQLVRQAATKAIHATATVSCLKKQDDDENDNDEDEDENDEDEAHDAAPATTLSLAGDREKDEDHDGDHAKTKPASMTFTGDAKSIADQAVAAMQVAFDTAKNAPASTPKPTHSPEQKKHDDKKHDSRGSEHHD